MSITNTTLPEGWTSEAPSKRYTLIRAPHGYVTIDWGHSAYYATRGFRGGMATTGRLASTAKYEGRGWKQRLLADAVKWLDGVEVAGQRDIRDTYSALTARAAAEREGRKARR